MSSSPPLRRDAERNRTRLLEAARVVFARDGLDAPLKDVAAEADVATATAYRHFADREALVDALFEDALTGMLELAEAAVAHEDPWQGLVDYVIGSLEIQAADRGVREAITQPSRGGERLQGSRGRLLPLADKVIKRARKAGVLRPEVTTTDLAILSTMLAFEIDYTAPAGAEPWRRHAKVVLDGLRARPEAERLPGRALSAEELAEIQDQWGARSR